MAAEYNRAQPCALVTLSLGQYYIVMGARLLQIPAAGLATFTIKRNFLLRTKLDANMPIWQKTRCPAQLLTFT